MYQHRVDIDTLGVLDLEWDDKWNYLTLAMNGQTLGNFKGKQSLLDGQRVALPDGREIYVHHDGKELNIWLNGRELLSGMVTGDSGTSDFNGAVSAIFVYGVFGIVVGLIRIFLATNYDNLDTLSILLITDVLAFGCILIALGFWAKYTDSKIPLYIALVIALVSIVLRSINGATIGVVIIGFFIYHLYKGIRATPSNVRRMKKIDMDGPLDANI